MPLELRVQQVVEDLLVPKVLLELRVQQVQEQQVLKVQQIREHKVLKVQQVLLDQQESHQDL